MGTDEAKLDDALAMAERWRDRRPTARKMLRRADVRSIRVLGPVQIRLRSLVEDRSLELRTGPAATGGPIEEPPTDPWAVDAEELSLEVMVQDATEERTRRETLDTIIRPCEPCEGTGRLRCPHCHGEGFVGTTTCPECDGHGEIGCRNCRGTTRRTVEVRLARRFRFREQTRIHEGEEDEVGPHVLLHLVDHPTEGEVLHEQEAPRIERYAGKGSGAGYRTAASPMAEAVELLLRATGPERGEAVAHQWLTVTRIPVYALELSRKRTAYVYGDPPEVSPPRHFRPAWLVAVPVLVGMALLVAVVFAFFSSMIADVGR